MALPFLLSISIGNRQAQELSQGEDSQGKIEMTPEAGCQGGREKAVGNAVVIDKVPAQAEKGKGKEIAEGFPEYEPGQDQEEEVPSRGPMEEYLAWMVLGRERVRFG